MIEYMGVAEIASACGTDQSAVSHWLKRWGEIIPEPDAVIGQARGKPVYGWLPERISEWKVFYELGRGRRAYPGAHARKPLPAVRFRAPAATVSYEDDSA